MCLYSVVILGRASGVGFGGYLNIFVESSRSVDERKLLVMCRLRLGLKAPALAWLEAARAWQNHRPGQKPKVGLGLAWLRLRPGLYNIINMSPISTLVKFSTLFN